MIRRHLLNILAITQNLKIISENSYLGKVFYCVAKHGNEQVFGTWSIISGSQYASINQNGKVTIVEGTQDQPIIIQCSYNGISTARTILISYDNQLTIEGASSMEGTSGNVICRYNSTTVTPTWSIISGGALAVPICKSLCRSYYPALYERHADLQRAFLFFHPRQLFFLNI